MRKGRRVTLTPPFTLRHIMESVPRWDEAEVNALYKIVEVRNLPKVLPYTRLLWTDCNPPPSPPTHFNTFLG